MDFATKALEILQETIKERQDQAMREHDFVVAEVLLDIREKAMLRIIETLEVLPAKGV